MNTNQNTKNQRFMKLLETTLGPIILKYLHDDDIIEIMLNPNGKLVIEYLGNINNKDIKYNKQDNKIITGHTISLEQAERILKLIASHNDTVVTSDSPMLAAELPIKNARFQGWVPPVVARSSFAIRKRAIKIFSLDDYVKLGALTKTLKDKLTNAIDSRNNIIIIGGTGSGKTTFANAILAQMAKSNSRILILEDLPELQCDAADHVKMVTTNTVSMQDLVKGSLRMRPDRIVVGEVRDGSALDLLKAWNTGHPGGVCTIHANSVIGGLYRLRDLMLEVVHNVPSSLITEAVDILIFIEKTKDGSYKIKEISKLTGEKNGDFIIEDFT